MKRTRLQASTITAFAFWVLLGVANASTVTIGLQQAGVNGGAITTVATGDGAANITGLSYGTFTSLSITGVRVEGLSSNTFNSFYGNLFSNLIAASTGGTLTVYVELANAVLPIQQTHGGTAIFSSFTSNSLPTGWTVQEDIYSGSGTFPTSLGGTIFTSAGTFQRTFGQGCPFVGGCSGTLTERYIISANGVGVTNDTIGVWAARVLSSARASPV